MANETKLERTSAGLAGAMFDELEALIEGRSNPQTTRAKAAVANTICSISRLEMDFARFVSDQQSKGDAKALPSLPMGLPS